MGTNRNGIFLLFLCISTFLLLIILNNNNSNKKAEINAKEFKKAAENNWHGKTKKIGEKMAKNGTNGEKTDEEDQNFEILFKNFRLFYHMEFENECPEQTKLIILSMSRRDGFEKRKGVRQTWMKDAVPGEEIRFLVADPSPGEATDVRQKLEEEQREHGDLVFLHGFNDTYQHIHLKWYGGLQWQQSFCAGAEWVMKADDDAIVHLRRLAYWTEKKFRQIAIQNPLVYFGHLNYWPLPVRDPTSKWFVSKEMFAGDRFPKFLQGCVYLATRATIRAILPLTSQVVGFFLDDVVFTGILAQLANVTLSNQKAHFAWGLGQYGKKYGEFGLCEEGTPATLSAWGVDTVKEYGQHYDRLQSMQCK